MIVGNTIVDGNVTWKVVNDQSTPSTSAGGGGNNGILYSNSPVGSILPYAVNDSLPDGYLICNGAEVLTDEYPELFSVIGNLYGTASDEYHFVLPDLRDKFIEGSTTAGDDIEAGLPNIKGVYDGSTNKWDPYLDGNFAGALYSNRANGARLYGSSNGTTSGTGIGLDASLYNSIYSDNINTVQPPAVTMIYIIKAINTIEIFENIQDENYIIIYPNNGTEESPANVTSNTMYVEDNPFPGYEVECKAELYVNGCWGHTEWVSNYGSGGWQAFGIVSHKDDDGNIRIITGSDGVLDGNDKNSSHTVSGHTFTNMASSWSLTTSAPCRIKVWKVNAINNTPVVKKTEVNVNRVDYAEGQSWCYIYPNNGTAESPANVTVSTTYINENPFPGYLVDSQPQLLIDGEWTAMGYVSLYSNQHLSEGMYSLQHNEDKIVTKTGTNYILITTGVHFNTANYSSLPEKASDYTTAPCRLRITKVGKLPE